MLDAGMKALLPNLLDASDTGLSSSDNLTSDRTPELVGSVQGPATEVRMFIDGREGDLLRVTNAAWHYQVPAESALGPGRHTFAVQPFDASGRSGPLSAPLPVNVVAQPPAAPSVGLKSKSDTGTKGDGETTFSTPMLTGFAQPNRYIEVSIDGVAAGRVKSNATTGEWSLRAPRLATGKHDITAVAENRAGIGSDATSFAITVNGERTVLLDASEGTAELMASHLLGRGSQGFIVTQVLSGTLQRWSASKNAWVNVPSTTLAGDSASLQQAPASRRIAFGEAVRWTPDRGQAGIEPAFSMIPLDIAGGLTDPIPQAGTVPGKVVDASIGGWQQGLGTPITWKDPTDGCGCPSTRYSVEVTREDGRTLLYNVPRSVHGISSVEGGTVSQSRIWGATQTGAGESRSIDLATVAHVANGLNFTIKSAASFMDLGTRAREQLANSPTGTQYTTSLPVGASHANLAYLEVNAVPTATEAAQGLPASLPMIVSSDSSKLTPKQLADLKSTPILASHLFPGTVGGEVQPDQVRAHFQAGQTLQFAGTVDPSVRAGATIVVEKAQDLADGSLGPWLQVARIPVAADGGYSYKYLVPYGENSVRARLEYQKQSVVGSVGSLGASSTPTTPISTPIDLSNYFNSFGITTAPWQVPNNQGFDGNGNYYNSDYTGAATSDPIPGTPINYYGISFPIGPIPTSAGQVGGSGTSATNNPPNFVRAAGQTIPVSVDAGKSDYLYLAGAASNGNQLSQNITLKFTDGTTETWTQSFHDWASDGPPQTNSNNGGYFTNTPQPYAVQKLPCRVASTEPMPNNIYQGYYGVAPTFYGLCTVDGVQLAVGDRVLVKNEAYEQYNGIYVAAEGQWYRSKDCVDAYACWGVTVPVTSGTVNGGKNFWENADTPLSADDVTFIEVAPPVRTPRPFAGELNIKTEPERINQLGNLVTTPAHVFSYCHNLHGKQLASITLPNNSNIGILSAVVSKAPVIALNEGFASLVLGTVHLTGIDLMALTIVNESNIGAGGGPLTFFFADQPVKGSTTTPPTYTTKAVTVPMGQQQTIAYIAPSSASQMTFYVQKADGSCVGPNCSTYLTDWTTGGGTNSNSFADKITPSLDSQMKAGQHWTMTIQNAGLGYNGYLWSPAGQGLPAASGGNPAGAQFKLMTQNEINDQPPWAIALEEALGEAIVLTGLAVLTLGTGDAAAAGTEIVDAAVEEVIVSSGSDTSESVAIDSFWDYYQGVDLTTDNQVLVKEVVDADVSSIIELGDGSFQSARDSIYFDRTRQDMIDEYNTYQIWLVKH